MDTLEKTIYAYKSVFNRNEVEETTFEKFLYNPEKIWDLWVQEGTLTEACYQIHEEENKPSRNELKRSMLPAVELSHAGILSIDIDNVSHSSELINTIVEKLRSKTDCYACKESASGNLVAFFRFDCTIEEYPFLYYKIYLELVLLLSVNIDFLPDIGRLRYVNHGEVFFVNENSQTLTEVIEVDELPIIKTAVNKTEARDQIYRSV